MKKLFRSILLLMTFGLPTWQLMACKHAPAPPSEQDAIAVWKFTHRNLHTQELQSLTKTNGQMQEAGGGYIYTLYYEAKVKDIVQLGSRAPGTVESYQSNYAFQWTEKGWMGPDKQVYPEH